MFTLEKAQKVYDYIIKEKPFEYGMIQIQKGNIGYMIIVQ